MTNASAWIIAASVGGFLAGRCSRLSPRQRSASGAFLFLAVAIALGGCAVASSSFN
jgi:hypothetical protein